MKLIYNEQKLTSGGGTTYEYLKNFMEEPVDITTLNYNTLINKLGNKFIAFVDLKSTNDEFRFYGFAYVHLYNAESKMGFFIPFTVQFLENYVNVRFVESNSSGTLNVINFNCFTLHNNKYTINSGYAGTVYVGIPKQPL